jgi:hypothetical protein
VYPSLTGWAAQACDAISIETPPSTATVRIDRHEVSTCTGTSAAPWTCLTHVAREGPLSHPGSEFPNCRFRRLTSYRPPNK